MPLVENIFHRCLSGAYKGELTAQNVSLYHNSPYTIYCEKFVSEDEKDPRSPYRELLQERGQEHERRVIERQYSQWKEIVFKEPKEGFLKLLEEMARGAEVICGFPILIKIEQKSLEHTLQEDRYGQEDVAELEERIESLDKRVGRLKTRLRAYEIIGEVLIEARQNILNNISSEVDTQIGTNFSLITGGKYGQVRLSRADFSLQVFSREKGDWINPDTAELSVGARDQLYLAARLALLDSITGGNSIPLILDDPLIHSDSVRRENTRKLFKEVSKKHQILIFSCHDHYDEWADQIISF